MNQIWDNLMPLGFPTSWVVRNPNQEGCEETSPYLQPTIYEGTCRRWRCLLPSVREKSALPFIIRCLTGKGMQGRAHLPPWVTLGLTKTSLHGKIHVFQKPRKGDKPVRLEEKLIISPYKSRQKQSFVTLSCYRVCQLVCK